jgi:hypothetical protein
MCYVTRLKFLVEARKHTITTALLALHEYTRFSFSIQGSSFVSKKVEWFSGLMSQYCRAGGRSAARKEWISILLWGDRGG